MIKKIIGALFTLATIAVIVFVAINFGNYQSLLPADLFSAKSVEVVSAAETVDVAPADNATDVENSANQE
jgi:hypothetical protein